MIYPLTSTLNMFMYATTENDDTGKGSFRAHMTKVK